MARRRSFFQRSKYYLLFLFSGLLIHLYINRHKITYVDDVLSTINHALFGNISPDGRIVEGIPTIIDGDTLTIAGQKVRLYAIDAPEMAQSCQNSERKRYSCGQYATNALRKLVQHQSIRCEKQSNDQYGRHVAICYLGNLEINRWMIQNGYAFAYRSISDRYTLEEELARQQKLGLWQGSFQMPWKWRKQQRP